MNTRVQNELETSVIITTQRQQCRYWTGSDSIPDAFDNSPLSGQAHFSRRHQSTPQQIHIEPSKGGKQVRSIHSEAAIAHFGETPRTFDAVKSVRPERTSTLMDTIYRSLASREWFMTTGSAVDPVADAAGFRALAMHFIPICLISIDPAQIYAAPVAAA